MPSSLGGDQVVTVIFILTPFSIIFLGLRLWSRHIKNVPLAFNDYMAILALIFTIGENAVSLVDAFLGTSGVHISEIAMKDPSLLQTFLKLITPGEILWAAANTCTKLSIISLYTTLFPIRTFHYVSYGTMVVSLAFFIVAFLEAFLLCIPIQFNLNKSISEDSCNQNQAFFAIGVINVIIDAFVVILPMPMLFTLQIPFLKRLGIAVMFSLGAVICILSLFRIISIQKWDFNDITFGAAQISIFTAVEPALGVVNACLPTIKPALYRICGKGGGDIPKLHHEHIGDTTLEEGRQIRMATDIHYSRFHPLDDQSSFATVRTANEVTGWTTQV
ncbi:hypothetical protein F5Y03DRAFT_400748 [Xylaria venustula]|nr:hypothetical protein F5Y03DRAFT_400748 [Xylaria venustula]